MRKVIFEELEKRAWTQHALAEKLGISDAQISRLLTGKRPLRTACARRIAGVLGIHLSILRRMARKTGEPRNGRSKKPAVA